MYYNDNLYILDIKQNKTAKMWIFIEHKVAEVDMYSN